MLTAARASHGEAASLPCARACLSVCLSVCLCVTQAWPGVCCRLFSLFPNGQADYGLASKQETWRDQPQKQETEERDQTTVLAGLTMSEQALDPNGSIGDEI